MVEDVRSDASDAAAPLDELFSTLADWRRRNVLLYFRQSRDEVATVDDLVEHVLDRDTAADDPNHVETVLHHVTLPTLEARRVVEYDPRSRSVRYRGDSLLEQYLELVAATTCAV